jgi:hypothetical protein
MPKFAPADSYEPELTENRKALAAMIIERDAVKAAANAESESSAKLGTVHDDVAPARAALAAFDAQQSVAWSNWSRGLVTGKPVADAARRAKLADDLADAELASAAATAAQDQCQSNAERFSHQLGAMEAKVAEHARLVALEEATALLPQIAEVIARAESLRRQLDAARAEVAEGQQFGVANSTGPACHEFDIARRGAESRPFESLTNPHALGWKKFVAALTQDASVDFDSAQSTSITLAPVHNQLIDPVVAAAQLVESFQSTSVAR